MKRLGGLICVLPIGVLLVSGATAAQGEDRGTCAKPFSVPAEAGMRLAISSKPAEVNLVGTDAREIRVTCTLDQESRADEVRIRFERRDGTGRLAVTDGPSNNVRITIEVPRQTHLVVRVPAGAIHVKDVAGDKDIDVHAGEVTISGVGPEEYRFVHASVEIGEVRSKAYSVDKGGFFRTLERSSNDGIYRLDAHIITGSIQLN